MGSVSGFGPSWSACSSPQLVLAALACVAVIHFGRLNTLPTPAQTCGAELGKVIFYSSVQPSWN